MKTAPCFTACRKRWDAYVEQTIKCLVKMLCGVLELFDRSPAFSITGQPNKKSQKTNGAES